MSQSNFVINFHTKLFVQTAFILFGYALPHNASSCILFLSFIVSHIKILHIFVLLSPKKKNYIHNISFNKMCFFFFVNKNLFGLQKFKIRAFIQTFNLQNLKNVYCCNSRRKESLLLQLHRTLI